MAAGEWEEVSTLKRERRNASAVVLDEFIYVIGGRSNCALRSVERFNPNTGAWTMVGGLKVARSHHRCCVINGSIYAVGGAGWQAGSIEKYDKGIDKWTTVSCTLHYQSYSYTSLHRIR